MTPWPRSRPVRQRKHPSIFHITESDQFLGHLTSKIGRFFLPPTPHDAMAAIPSSPEKTSPYIPYHRVGPLLWTFTLKNRCFFRRGNSPCRCRPPPTRIGAKNILSPSISPSQTTFWDILPQKTGGKKEGTLPFAASFAAVIICRRRNPRSPLGKFEKTSINYCNSS